MGYPQELHACVYHYSWRWSIACQDGSVRERLTDNEDVLAKTRKIEFPVFKEIPIRFDELTYGDLARYVKQYIIPDFVGEKEEGNE